MPFGGITHFVTFTDVEALLNFLVWIGNGCGGAGHLHNVAVAFDGNRVHGSDLLVGCAERWSDSWEDDL